jgi:hypothetical protein
MKLSFINTYTISLQLFLYIYCYELTITGLLEIKLFGDLICNGHQQLCVLLVGTIGA